MTNSFGRKASRPSLIGLILATSFSLLVATTSTSQAASAAAAKPYVAMAKAPCDVSQKNIYWLSVLKGHPTLRLWQQGFLDEAKRLGYKSATIAAPDDADWTKSVALGEGILAAKPDGLVLGFIDPAEKDLIAKFAAAGVPVTMGHVVVKPNQYPGLVAFAAFDAPAWGKSAADVIGAKIKGKGTVAVSEGSFNAEEDLVAAAFKKEMNHKYPKVKVLKPIVEGFDPPKAISIASSLLLAHPDVVGALSTTGAGPVTWAGAADQTSRTVYAIGPDATRPNMDAVKAGKILGIAAQPGYEEHEMAVDLLTQAICSQKPKFANLLPAPIVTARGLAPYYKVADEVDARVASQK